MYRPMVSELKYTESALYEHGYNRFPLQLLYRAYYHLANSRPTLTIVPEATILADALRRIESDQK